MAATSVPTPLLLGVLLSVVRIYVMSCGMASGYGIFLGALVGFLLVSIALGVFTWKLLSPDWYWRPYITFIVVAGGGAVGFFIGGFSGGMIGQAVYC